MGSTAVHDGGSTALHDTGHEGGTPAMSLYTKHYRMQRQ